MERVSPGAFRKTFTENRDRIKVLFQHGHDAQIGDKPLGQIIDLREDTVGAAYQGCAAVSCTWPGFPRARIGEQVGHDDLITTARTYTHVLVDEIELDYAALLA
jgi:hypothetical protein